MTSRKPLARVVLVRHSSLSAFTLVELLVVIGIIAVLVGILLPTLSAARSNALTIKCMSNLRQLSQASLMHAQVHKGFLPLAGQITLATGITSIPDGLWDRGRLRYTYAKAGDVSAMAAFQVVPLPAAIAPFLGYKDMRFDDWDVLDQQLNGKDGVWKMFTCAGTDSLNNGMVSQNSTDNTPVNQGKIMAITLPSGQTSTWWSTNSDYAPNEAILGFHQNPQYSKSRRRGSTAGIRKSTETVLFSDAKRRVPPSNPMIAPSTDDPWIVWSTNIVTVGPVTLADALSGNGKAVDKTQFDLTRHRKSRGPSRMNISFIDGHVETKFINTKDLANTYLIAP